MPQSADYYISYAGIIQIRSRVYGVNPPHLSQVYSAPLIQFKQIISMN